MEGKKSQYLSKTVAKQYADDMAALVADIKDHTSLAAYYQQVNTLTPWIRELCGAQHHQDQVLALCWPCVVGGGEHLPPPNLSFNL
jgi:hypothetical protein